jgi:hypothetical protein
MWSISPLEGEMPGRAEGGKTSALIFHHFFSAKPTPLQTNWVV